MRTKGVLHRRKSGQRQGAGMALCRLVSLEKSHHDEIRESRWLRPFIVEVIETHYKLFFKDRNMITLAFYKIHAD